MSEPDIRDPFAVAFEGGEPEATGAVQGAAPLLEAADESSVITKAVRAMEARLDEGIACPYCQNVMPCGPETQTRADILTAIASVEPTALGMFIQCDNTECPSAETGDVFHVFATQKEGQVQFTILDQAQVNLRIIELNVQYDRAVRSGATQINDLKQENSRLESAVEGMRAELEAKAGLKHELEEVRAELGLVEETRVHTKQLLDQEMAARRRLEGELKQRPEAPEELDVDVDIATAANVSTEDIEALRERARVLEGDLRFLEAQLNHTIDLPGLEASGRLRPFPEMGPSQRMDVKLEILNELRTDAELLESVLPLFENPLTSEPYTRDELRELVARRQEVVMSADENEDRRLLEEALRFARRDIEDYQRVIKQRLNPDVQLLEAVMPLLKNPQTGEPYTKDELRKLVAERQAAAGKPSGVRSARSAPAARPADDRTGWERFLDENPLGRLISKMLYS